MDYPSTLPDFRVGKTRRHRESFKTVYPLQGVPYTQKVTIDEPWIMTVEIVCGSRSQAQEFQSWLKTVNRGQTFQKDILTENGRETYIVGWLEAPLQPSQPSTNIFIYSGTIYAKQLTPVV